MYDSIPYEGHTRNEIARYDGYCSSVFYGYNSGLDVDVTAEDSSNRRRRDLAVRAGGHMYLFEFKAWQENRSGAAQGGRCNYRHTGSPDQLFRKDATRTWLATDASAGPAQVAGGRQCAWLRHLYLETANRYAQADLEMLAAVPDRPVQAMSLPPDPRRARTRPRPEYPIGSAASLESGSPVGCAARCRCRVRRVARLDRRFANPKRIQRNPLWDGERP